MDNQKLETLISDAKNSLLQLARESCWNKLPDKCLYIVTYYENSELNFHKQREIRKTVNDKLKPQRLADLLPQLLSIYDNIHNIELLLYKADKKFNIIEIQVNTKNLLEPEYREKNSGNIPDIHCKIAIPFYHNNPQKKFDVNWEHQTLRNRMYLLRNKLRYFTGRKSL